MYTDEENLKYADSASSIMNDIQALAGQLYAELPNNHKHVDKAYEKFAEAFFWMSQFKTSLNAMDETGKVR